jgi:hypothetical protein
MIPARVPWSSILYCRLVARETRIRTSWRGVGISADTRALADISARLDALEDLAGPGMAWTAVDEVLARPLPGGRLVWMPSTSNGSSPVVHGPGCRCLWAMAATAFGLPPRAPS